MNFFYYESKFKLIRGCGGRRGIGARVSDFFLTKNPNLKKKFLGGGGGGGGGGSLE